MWDSVQKYVQTARSMTDDKTSYYKPKQREYLRETEHAPHNQEDGDHIKGNTYSSR
jgi:hypothetical protein